MFPHTRNHTVARCPARHDRPPHSCLDHSPRSIAPAPLLTPIAACIYKAPSPPTLSLLRPLISSRVLARLVDTIHKLLIIHPHCGWILQLARTAAPSLLGLSSPSLLLLALSATPRPPCYSHPPCVTLVAYHHRPSLSSTLPLVFVAAALSSLQRTLVFPGPVHSGGTRLRHPKGMRSLMECTRLLRAPAAVRICAPARLAFEWHAMPLHIWPRPRLLPIASFASAMQMPKSPCPAIAHTLALPDSHTSHRLCRIGHCFPLVASCFLRYCRQSRSGSHMYTASILRVPPTSPCLGGFVAALSLVSTLCVSICYVSAMCAYIEVNA